MIIAKKQKQENIISYILYMWQIEDTIRAYDFNLDKIKNQWINMYNTDDATKKEIINWYDNLIEMMKLEQIKSSGHLQVIKNIVNDINRLHIELLNNPKEIAYKHIYNATLPFIKDFENKTNNKVDNHIELCLTGIYGQYLLKLQKKNISQATSDAVKAFGNLLNFLSAKYKEENDNEKKNSELEN